MKNNIIVITLFAIGCVSAEASIIVPGANGTDGALVITDDTVIDLSQAPTGTWNQDNSANAGKGVYDPEKWAVVFKYTDVTIASGKTVTFKNHGSRAPVVWLVSGDVAVAGTVDLSGQSVNDTGNAAQKDLWYHPDWRPFGGLLSEPGPGGFRGGAGWRGSDTLHSAGFGPGGGHVRSGSLGWWWAPENKGGSAGYGTESTRRDWWQTSGKSYGNRSLIPLIGGSGGGGNNDDGWGRPGGAGGGAILIACTGQITMATGQIIAKGGHANWDKNGAGSGGGIRLVCSSLLGTGGITASRGEGATGEAGDGRIRIERIKDGNIINVVPIPSMLDLSDGATALLWPPAGSPTAKVFSINTISAPADPRASFGTESPDVALPLVSSVDVIVETTGVEPQSKVIIRVTPRNGMTLRETDSNGNQNNTPMRDAQEAEAVVDDSFTPPTPGLLHWKATLPTLTGYSAVQARVIRP